MQQTILICFNSSRNYLHVCHAIQLFVIRTFLEVKSTLTVPIGNKCERITTTATTTARKKNAREYGTERNFNP